MAKRKSKKRTAEEISDEGRQMYEELADIAGRIWCNCDDLCDLMKSHATLEEFKEIKEELNDIADQTESIVSRIEGVVLND